MQAGRVERGQVSRGEGQVDVAAGVRAGFSAGQILRVEHHPVPVWIQPTGVHRTNLVSTGQIKIAGIANQLPANRQVAGRRAEVIAGMDLSLQIAAGDHVRLFKFNLHFHFRLAVIGHFEIQVGIGFGELKMVAAGGCSFRQGEGHAERSERGERLALFFDGLSFSRQLVVRANQCNGVFAVIRQLVPAVIRRAHDAAQVNRLAWAVDRAVSVQVHGRRIRHFHRGRDAVFPTVDSRRPVGDRHRKVGIAGLAGNGIQVLIQSPFGRKRDGHQTIRVRSAAAHFRLFLVEQAHLQPVNRLIGLQIHRPDEHFIPAFLEGHLDARGNHVEFDGTFIGVLAAQLGRTDLEGIQARRKRLAARR